MNELSLIKSESFGNVPCDFWQDSNGNTMVTRKQIGDALGYSDPQKAIDNLHSKYKGRMDKFSVTLKVRGTDGKEYDTVLYNSKGIYEICRRSQQPKADDFYDWVYELLEGLNKGQIKIVSVSEGKRKEIDARYNNSLARKANILLKIANNPDINPRYRQILQSQASAIVTGQPLLPLPEAEERTYTAAEIGEALGISSNMVGRIAIKNNLKIPEYGKLFHDKSPYSSKEVESFRYFENVMPKIKEAIEDRIVDIGR
jgi:prophage antirepressor-like protein